jgi:hypothetical protein
VPPPSGPISQAASQQHSFSMSQPSPSLMAAPPSYRRSFSDMSARFSNEGPGIYSVCALTQSPNKTPLKTTH